MKKNIGRIISLLVILSTLLTAMPFGIAAEESEQDSVVVINDSLKTEESLSLFTHTFGCSPELKVVDGETVGLTMGGATSALGYPYMLFGEADWEDYILEFTSHDLWRVGGIVRSQGGVSNNDGYGGLLGLYETTRLDVRYASYNAGTKTYSSPQIKDGTPAGVSFTHKGDMRFVIRVEGEKMVTSVTYVTSGGKTVTKTVSVNTSVSGMTAGRPGLRAVFNQVNGDKSSGYFSDLRVTLLGDTATKYKENNKYSKVVIDDSLKTEASLALFTDSFGCTPALKEIDGEVVGVTMAGATSALGYPYMLFGEDDWQDYILEFTTHDLWRVSGITRSTDAAKHNDGYGGLLAAYETSTLVALYSSPNGSGYTSPTLKNGGTPNASFTYKGEMRFIIKVVGDRMTCTVRYTNDAGRLVSRTIDVNTAESGKSAGKLGLRAVFNQVNGAVSSGYFSDLKVTLLGEATENYHVVIDDSLKSSESLSLFTKSFGCTPELKVVEDKTVGVTMGGATSALGYPYMLFGEADWEDYILEFTAHDLWRVSGIVRSTDAIKHNDGYGGILALYETTILNTAYPVNNTSTTTIKNGTPASASFTYKGDMRFTVRVKGENMTTTVRYYNDAGALVTHTINVNVSETGKTAGQLGLRAVYNQVNGAVSNGYFSDLKVTLLGDTAQKYQKENPTVRYVAIDETLKDAADLEMFEAYGCTPALKTVDGEAVGMTLEGATSALGYPYVLFGEEEWEDYILEFTAHGMWRVGGILRSTDAVDHIDGYGGLLAAYETSTLVGLYSSYDGTTYTSPTLKNGDNPNASFTYKGDMRFVIKVAGEKMTCTVSYTDDSGAPVSHTIDVSTAGSGKSAGKLGLRAVFNQVNGDKAEGYFSDLKVTLLGETARKYKAVHDPDVYPDIVLNPGTGDSTYFVAVAACVSAACGLILLISKKRAARKSR